MRMWNVDTNVMCNKHLLGEHVEMHMFVGTIKLNKSIKGFLDKNLVEVHNIQNRHDTLVKEMLKRGIKHNSKLEFVYPYKLGKVDVLKNKLELANRCNKCRELQK